MAPSKKREGVLGEELHGIRLKVGGGDRALLIR